MAENTKIEWCATFDASGNVVGPGATANLWHGCTKVHEGCDNCYAEALAKRFGNDIWGNDKNRLVVKKVWTDLDKFQKKAAANNHKMTVFVGSMMDIFELNFPVEDKNGNPVFWEHDDNTPLGTNDLRLQLFSNISNNIYPNLVFLFLTKRPSNINKLIPEPWKETPPENVWFGCSVVNQKTANNLVPQLLKVKGKKFLSVEPQLDKIDLRESGAFGGDFYYDSIRWVINGGESGQNRRPFDLDWARHLKQECRVWCVPYFFKQIDKVRDKSEGIPADLQIRQYPQF